MSSLYSWYADEFITRQVGAFESFCQLRNVSASITLEYVSFWCAFFNVDDVDETNAIEIVTYSGISSGGNFGVTTNYESGDATRTTPVVHTLPQGGWPTAPPFSERFGQAYQFNISSGWRWNRGVNSAGGIVRPPNDTNGIGFRLVNQLSSSMKIRWGGVIKHLGG